MQTPSPRPAYVARQGIHGDRVKRSHLQALALLPGRGGHSVLGSVLLFFKEIRFLENENRSVLKNFWNRTFRFSVISVRFRF